jgi:hypothetical protein
VQLRRLLRSLALLLLLLAALGIYSKGLPWATGKIMLIYVADADEVNAAPAQAISPGVTSAQPVISESKSNAAALITITIDRAKTRPVTTVRFEGL